MWWGNYTCIQFDFHNHLFLLTCLALPFSPPFNAYSYFGCSYSSPYSFVGWGLCLIFPPLFPSGLHLYLVPLTCPVHQHRGAVWRHQPSVLGQWSLIVDHHGLSGVFKASLLENSHRLWLNYCTVDRKQDNCHNCKFRNWLNVVSGRIWIELATNHRVLNDRKRNLCKLLF